MPPDNLRLLPGRDLADFIICNTVEELEPETVSALMDKLTTVLRHWAHRPRQATQVNCGHELVGGVRLHSVAQHKGPWLSPVRLVRELRPSLEGGPHRDSPWAAAQRGQLRLGAAA